MSALTQALNRILDRRPDCISYLQPGLTYHEIEEKVKDLPFRLPQEVYELYQWRNGMMNDSEIEFFPGYEFLSLEEALKDRYIVSENLGFLLPFGWFPLFYFQSQYFAAIGTIEDTVSSPIIFTYHGNDLSYTNLTNMMLVIAECYEIGAYYTDESRYLQENEIATKAVLKKYEPELHYEGQPKEEVFTNSEGHKVMVRRHPDSNNILYATTIDNDRNVKEISHYFQSKIVQRTLYKCVEGYSSCMVTENWFNNYEVYEEYCIEYKPKHSKTKMERRYINGVLKEEVIHPDPCYTKQTSYWKQIIILIMLIFIFYMFIINFSKISN